MPSSSSGVHTENAQLQSKVAKLQRQLQELITKVEEGIAKNDPSFVLDATAAAKKSLREADCCLEPVRLKRYELSEQELAAKQTIKAVFEQYHASKGSLVSIESLTRFVSRCLKDVDVDILMRRFCLQQGITNKETMVCYKAFIDFVFLHETNGSNAQTPRPEFAPDARTTHCKTSESKVCSCQVQLDDLNEAKLPAFNSKAAGLRVTWWNTNDPEFSGNILQQYPAWGTLLKAAHADLLGSLFKFATDAILSSESPTLEYLLGDMPIQELERISSFGGVESLPMRVPLWCHRGLKTFFHARLEPTLSEEELENFVQTWLSDPSKRWNYWKKQTLRDFVLDDGSGGKANDNPEFPEAKDPNLDSLAQCLSLRAAESCMQYAGERSERLEFLIFKKADHAKTNHEIDTALNHGACQHDFFKLLVWDLVLVALKNRARSKWSQPGEGTEPENDLPDYMIFQKRLAQQRWNEQRWNETYDDIKKALSAMLNKEKSLENTTKLVAESRSDIVILSEVSKGMIEHFAKEVIDAGGLWYRTLHAKELLSKNIVVLVRKSLFPQAEVAEVIPFPGESENQQSTNKLRIRLVSRFKSVLHVIALCLSETNKTMQSKNVFDTIEACLAEDPSGAFVVAGDFDFDIREKELRDAMLSDQRPRLTSLLNDSEPLWNIPMNYGTISKTRTAFQVEVSKIERHKFSMKDFILVSGNLQPAKGQLQGMITQHSLLPNAQCPSDHAPLTWNVEPDSTLHPLEFSTPSSNSRFFKKEIHLTRQDLDEEKTVASDLNGLSCNSLSMVKQYIAQVRRFQEVHVAYEALSDDIRATAAELIRVLNRNDGDTPNQCHGACWSLQISQKQFQILYHAISSMCSPIDDCCKEFDKIDTTKSGLVCAAEIMNWMDRLLDSVIWKSSIAEPSEPFAWVATPGHLAGHISLNSTKDLRDCLNAAFIRVRANFEVEKYEMTQELMDTMQQYGEAYQELLCTDSKVEINNENRVESKNGNNKPLQPEECDTFEKLAEHGKAIMELVNEFGEEMKHRIGAPFWSMGPLKDPVRGQEKIDQDYDGNARGLIDVVRMSMICKDLEMIKSAINFVENDPRFDILRIKSGFDPESSASVAMSGGYRDVKLNVRHQESGHVVEIQLHLLLFYMIKREGGHVLYEWSRKFSVTGITSAEDVLADLSEGLLEEMTNLAQHGLSHAIKKNGLSSKKTFRKRVALFQCLELSGKQLKDKLQEHGTILLGNIGVTRKADDYLVPGLSTYDYTQVLLMIAKTYQYHIAQYSTREFLNLAVDLVQRHQMREICLHDELFLARCKETMIYLWDKHNKTCNKDFKEALKMIKIKDTKLFKDAGLNDEMNLQESKESLDLFKSIKLLKNALGKPYLEIDCSSIVLKLLPEPVQDPKTRGMTLWEMLFVALCQNALGNHIWSTNWKECIEKFEHALQILKKDIHFNDNHPLVAKIQKNLGAALLRDGQTTAGIQELEKAQDVWTRLFGPYDYRTAKIDLILGQTYQKISKWKSLWYLHRCLTSRIQSFGRLDARVGNVTCDIAMAHFHNNDLRNAREEYKLAAEILESVGSDKDKRRLTRMAEQFDKMERAHL